MKGPKIAKPLMLMDYDQYREQRLATDNNTDDVGPSALEYVVRTSTNDFILTPASTRVHTVMYEGFSLPDALEDYDDVPVIPSAWEQVIVDKALHYAYMFRDNLEQAALAQDRYEKNVVKMRRILIPQTSYYRFEG
jgi:hypothetical protein